MDRPEHCLITHKDPDQWEWREYCDYQQARIDRLLQELEATRAIGDEKQARIEALEAENADVLDTLRRLLPKLLTNDKRILLARYPALLEASDE